MKPTLILLDIVMPKMNGIEILEKLKADSETKNIPVIVLTNLSGLKDAEKALKLGAEGYTRNYISTTKEQLACVVKLSL